MAPISLDGNSVLSADVRTNLCCLICLRHSSRSRASTNIFFPKYIFPNGCATRSELPSHIYVPCSGSVLVFILKVYDWWKLDILHRTPVAKTSGLRIRLLWSDPVFKICSDPDPVFNICFDPDPVFKICSDPDPGFKNLVRSGSRSVMNTKPFPKFC